MPTIIDRPREYVVRRLSEIRRQLYTEHMTGDQMRDAGHVLGLLLDDIADDPPPHGNAGPPPWMRGPPKPVKKKS